ncbi:hypothetical protein E2C01_039452 [Portunus trituberculatus]|uniref:Uncharacterized protein n=1 Tax=Portunus trituberculatus TaxID=210409 RepID=A0A5B7FJW2_PORTR|nr:hypothetical protein [Portunus trituberculatus]
MEGLNFPAFYLEPSGTTATRWDTWLRRFDNIVVAHAVTSADRKRALLLHCAAEEVFQIAETLLRDEDTYEQLKTKLTVHFAPKRNVEYEVFVFRQATQQPEEHLDKFYVRDKGLSDPDISLVNLLTFGCTLEAITVRAQAMAPVQVHEAQVSVNSVRNKGGNSQSYVRRRAKDGSVEASAQYSYRCYGCDTVHFDTREKVCKAWGQKCFKCGKLNNFANFCKARTWATRTWRANNLLAEPHPVDVTPPENCLGEGRESSTAEETGEVMPMYTLGSTLKNEPYTCALELNGIPTHMEITIISVQQLKKLEQGAGSLSISKDGVPQLRTYTRQLLHTLGRVWLEVKYGQKTSRLSALVAPGSGPCFWGETGCTNTCGTPTIAGATCGTPSTVGATCSTPSTVGATCGTPSTVGATCGTPSTAGVATRGSPANAYATCRTTTTAGATRSSPSNAGVNHGSSTIGAGEASIAGRRGAWFKKVHEKEGTAH